MTDGADGGGPLQRDRHRRPDVDREDGGQGGLALCVRHLHLQPCGLACLRGDAGDDAGRCGQCQPPGECASYEAIGVGTCPTSGREPRSVALPDHRRAGRRRDDGEFVRDGNGERPGLGDVAARIHHPDVQTLHLRSVWRGAADHAGVRVQAQALRQLTRGKSEAVGTSSA